MQLSMICDNKWKIWISTHITLVSCQPAFYLFSCFIFSLNHNLKEATKALGVILLFPPWIEWRGHIAEGQEPHEEREWACSGGIQIIALDGWTWARDGSDSWTQAPDLSELRSTLTRVALFSLCFTALAFPLLPF